ncbi:hypothetical protein BH09VER1_BH09VER1_47680 [soil metagenome]
MNPIAPANQRRKPAQYEDLVFKSKYRSRLARFTATSTWIRPVPPLANSAYNWMMKVRIVEFTGGRYAHPRTFETRDACPFDAAYRWMVAHHPEKLFSRQNRGGLRLLSREMTLAWIILEEGSRPTPKLFLGSAFDGGQEGTPGLGFQLRIRHRPPDIGLAGTESHKLVRKIGITL